MEIIIKPAHPTLREINQIDPAGIKVGHGIGINLIQRVFNTKGNQLSFLADLLPQDQVAYRDYPRIVFGWVTEVMPGGVLKIDVEDFKLGVKYLTVTPDQVESHCSAERWYQSHVKPQERVLAKAS